MKVRQYSNDKDFEIIKDWITDERMHAMWCANLTPYPLCKEGFGETLKVAASRFGDVPYIALTDDNEAAGFFCYSKNSETNEGMLKFVVVNPAYRGKGIAGKMLRLASVLAFEDTKADALQLNVFPENERAKKCYLKAGFTERNTTKNAFTFKDESWGRCNMVLIKDRLS